MFTSLENSFNLSHFPLCFMHFFIRQVKFPSELTKFHEGESILPYFFFMPWLPFVSYIGLDLRCDFFPNFQFDVFVRQAVNSLYRVCSETKLNCLQIAVKLSGMNWI